MDDIHDVLPPAPSCAYSLKPQFSSQKMIGSAAGACPISDSFEPDEDDEYAQKGIIKAPNVNLSASKRHRFARRLLIDSRNRSLALHPNANDFIQHLPHPMKAVRAITLTDIMFPLVDATTYMYAVVCLMDLNGAVIAGSREADQFPMGSLAVVPIIPAFVGSAHAYYRSIPGTKWGGAGGSWRLEFPQGTTLNQLHFSIYTWGGAPSTSMLLPITADVAPNYIFARNLFLTLEIEHDV